MSDPRTFGELLQGNAQQIGTCQFCRTKAVVGYRYALRASVCIRCCELHRDRLLPKTEKSERKARGLARRYRNLTPAMIQRMSGGSIDYITQQMEESK